MSDYQKLFRIGFINIFLVLISYFLVAKYGGFWLSISRSIRILYLIYSFFALKSIHPYKNIKHNYLSVKIFYLFIFLCTFSAFTSDYPVKVILKLFNFIPFIFIPIFFINTSFEKLGIRNTKKLILDIFIRAYSIPLISSIYFNGNYYLGKNLYNNLAFSYGDNILADGFLANQLSWSAIIVLASSISYLQMYSVSFWRKLFTYFLILFSL